VPSEEPGGTPADIPKITDARRLRALAHPVRVALLEALLHGGPMTATEAGEAIGETPTTCSFHLRQLARYGFVEEAGGGRGRSRPWRLAGAAMSIDPGRDDPAAQLASEAVLRVFRERQQARYQRWRAARSSYPPGWQEAATDSYYTFYLTEEELARLSAELGEVLSRWYRLEDRVEDPSRRPHGSAPVETVLLSYPIAPPGRRPGADDGTGNAR
jgi:DNA-binding transcriptional ArsR family regulator